jgi:hypothetical protein
MVAEGQRHGEVREMYGGMLTGGWRVAAATAAVAGYLVGRYGPRVKKSAESALKDAVKCGLRASDELRGWATKAQATVKAYLDEVRAEMAQEAAAEQPAAEQA